MGDEKDLSATLGPEPATRSAPPPAPVSVVPRPVSVVPRPSGVGAPPTSRMPPPPSARGLAPTALSSALASEAGGHRSSPPPPPLRQPSPADSSTTLAARSSVVPRLPATPPPPAPDRATLAPTAARPLSPPMGSSATAQLEQRLGATQIELRKLGSERHTLRARLRRETDRCRELESALGAEKDLRRQATDEHFTVLSGLRARLSEVEAARARELDELRAELESEHARALDTLRSEFEQARAQTSAAERVAAEAERRVREQQAAVVPVSRPAKVVLGLRRIRGIGPAYQRELEQLGVTRVQQVAEWSASDVVIFAAKLRIKPERIVKDDWVGQAKSLEPDAER